MGRFINVVNLTYHMVENINNINLDIIGLYANGYLSQFHVREMAKLIGKSHVGLLPHLKKFEMDKILKSKFIGRSKVYSLNHSNNQVAEYLSLSEKKKTLGLLSKEFFIKKIYDDFIGLDLSGSLILFGSYASGSMIRESDIDLLYIGVKNAQINKIKELGKVYNRQIHLISMTLEQFRDHLSKKSALVEEIVNNHIILYNHDIFIKELWRHYH